MRGLAALGVVVAHAVDTVSDLGARVEGAFLPTIPAANDFGACGVDLFFVISGFVMTYSISEGTRISAARFAWNRFKRIVPAFWLASLVYVLLRLALGDRVEPQSVLATLTIVPLTGRDAYVFPALYVGWTLAFELCFYLMVAAILATGCRPVRLAILASVGMAALVGVVWRPATMPAPFIANPIYLEFACGVVGYLLFRRGFHGAYARRALIGLMAGFLVTIAVVPIDLGISMHPVAIINGEIGLQRALMFGLVFMLLVLGSIEPERTTGRPGLALLMIGRASYSLYLTHSFVTLGVGHAWFGTWRPNVYVSVAFIVSSSVLLALIVHRYLERPLLRWFEGWPAAGWRARPTERIAIADAHQT